MLTVPAVLGLVPIFEMLLLVPHTDSHNSLVEALTIGVKNSVAEPS